MKRTMAVLAIIVLVLRLGFFASGVFKSSYSEPDPVMWEVSGHVWCKQVGNGCPGTWVIYILPGVATYATSTDANGFYFLSVQEGTYTVVVVRCGDAWDYHPRIEVYSDCTHDFTSYPTTECPAL